MVEMDTVVRLHGVHKSYGRNQVLRGMEFDIAKGEIVGLLGPNGSGKTTTLRIISGFLAPDRGEVEICGIAMGPNARAARRCVGYIPERPPLYDPLSVTQYLSFIAAAKDIAKNKRQRAMDAVIETYNLGDVRGQPVGRLSKGFRQRVGLAQATLGDPEVLLLDEATNGLDPLQIVDAREMIRRGGSGRAVIFSSHIMQEVATLCSRVVVMHDGRVLKVERSDADSSVQILDIELAGPKPEQASRTFKDLQGVASVEVLPSLEQAAHLRLTAEPGHDIRAAVAQLATETGQLRFLATCEASLEDRFIESIAAARAAHEANDTAS
jgi:ABC-2 type transport system ATP-binding protein